MRLCGCFAAIHSLIKFVLTRKFKAILKITEGFCLLNLLIDHVTSGDNLTIDWLEPLHSLSLYSVKSDKDG